MKANFFADDPDGFGIKEMGAPAGSRKRQGPLWINQQKQKSNDDRQSTRPIPTQRRELLETSGVSSAVEKQMQGFAQESAAGAIAHGASEQCLDREVAANSFAVIWNLRRLFAKRHAQQELGQVETGEQGGDWLDETGIAIDVAGQVLLCIENVIERQGPMPVEVTAETVKMRTHDRPAHAFLQGRAAAGAAHELPGNMHGDKPAAAEDGLRVFDRPGGDILNENGRSLGGRTAWRFQRWPVRGRRQKQSARQRGLQYQSRFSR